jgi:hypothetical protein
MYDIRNLTISSTNPCLVVYLVDQSFSMSERFGNSNHNKAVEVANAINEIIYEIGLVCLDGPNGLKNRFEIAILGYGKEKDSVFSAWEGSLSGKWFCSINEIFNNAIGILNDKPIWVRPISGQNTPMTKAFAFAKRICNDWINWGNHKDCHPPIIINITDGEATDAGSNFLPLIDEVQKIKQLRTNFGHVNILNVHISSTSGNEILFTNETPLIDKFGKLLYDISTPLNDNMIRIAREKGYTIYDGAKGYVFNGSATDLINFLNIGTPK